MAKNLSDIMLNLSFNENQKIGSTTSVNEQVDAMDVFVSTNLEDIISVQEILREPTEGTIWVTVPVEEVRGGNQDKLHGNEQGNNR